MNSLGRSQRRVFRTFKLFVTEEEAAALHSDQLLLAAADANAALTTQVSHLLVIRFATLQAGDL